MRDYLDQGLLLLHKPLPNLGSGPMRRRQKEVGKDGDDDEDEDEVEGDSEDPCEGEKRKRFVVSSKY